jgi:hypothetical protein
MSWDLPRRMWPAARCAPLTHLLINPGTNRIPGAQEENRDENSAFPRPPRTLLELGQTPAPEMDLTSRSSHRRNRPRLRAPSDRPCARRRTRREPGNIEVLELRGLRVLRGCFCVPPRTMRPRRCTPTRDSPGRAREKDPHRKLRGSADAPPRTTLGLPRNAADAANPISPSAVHRRINRALQGGGGKYSDH